jgi:hypothetical protein
VNQQLIEKYVAGKLDEAQAAAFEEYCLMNPEFARQVEFEQRLKAGLEQVASGSTAEFVRAERSGFWRLAAAASVVLIITAGVWIWQRMPLAAGPHVLAEVSGPQRDGTFMRLALVRGSEHMPELPGGPVRVEIAGLFEVGMHYSVALDRMGHMRAAQSIGTLQGLHPESSVALEVMIDSDRLEPGTYALRVRKQAGADEPLDFYFVKR